MGLRDFTTNPRCTTYAYFVCSGRAAKKTTCTRQFLCRLRNGWSRTPTQTSRSARPTTGISLSRWTRRSTSAERAATRTSPTSPRTGRLEVESDKLLVVHFADAIDLPTLKRHQGRIRAGLADIEHRLTRHDEQHTGGRAFLHDSLRLLTDAHRAYAHSDDGSRRLANQAFYTRLEITEDERLRPRLAEPFATIVHEATGGREAKREHPTSSDVACSRKTLLGGAEGTIHGWAVTCADARSAGAGTTGGLVTCGVYGEGRGG